MELECQAHPNTDQILSKLNQTQPNPNQPKVVPELEMELECEAQFADAQEEMKALRQQRWGGGRGLLWGRAGSSGGGVGGCFGGARAAAVGCFGGAQAAAMGGAGVVLGALRQQRWGGWGLFGGR
jgi:hypothetical protein